MERRKRNIVDSPGKQDCSYLSQISVRVANVAERRKALALRKRVYRRDYGQYFLDSYEEYAVHVVASIEDGDVIGTIRLFGPGPNRLELEEHVSLKSIVPPGTRTIQLSGFCVDHEFRRVSRAFPVAARLYDYAIRLASLFSAEFLVVRTPFRSLVRLYATAGFREVPHLRFFDVAWGWNSTMCARLTDLRQFSLVSFRPGRGINP